MPAGRRKAGIAAPDTPLAGSPPPPKEGPKEENPNTTRPMRSWNLKKISTLHGITYVITYVGRGPSRDDPRS